MIALQTQIGGIHKPVSRIIYGMAIQPFITGQNGDELLDAVLSSGINTFDLARNYGLAEKSMGAWLEHRGCRDQIVILSKCAHPSMFGRKRVNEQDIRKDFRKSCEALHTEYIDLYLLHRDDPDVPIGEIVNIMNTLHAEGKIHAFGGSNWTVERLEAANEYADAHHLIPFSVSSPNFGLAEQVRDPWDGTCVTISGRENEATRAWYRANQMPVIAYSSLGHGFFSGKMKSSDASHPQDFLDGPAQKGYVSKDNFERLRRCELLAKRKNATVPQIAMRWIFSQGMNTFAVVSSSKPDRIQENLAALQINLTQAEADYLDLKVNTL